jgi:hypothetical protein
MAIIPDIWSCTACHYINYPEEPPRTHCLQCGAAYIPELLCVVCGEPITGADWHAERVVASIGPQGIVAACASHLTLDGPDGPEYLAAVKTIAQATADQIRAAGF